MTDAATTQATFCATLVDEWARAGVEEAFVAPGSRSTPLALALAAHGRLRVHVFHDERAAAFAALGVGLATGRPAVVLCTSGTAAAHLHAAVIEADLSCVPLIACTADRPPELRDVGAPQTIDQTGLYGRAVRWFADPGVPDRAAEPTWRAFAARAVVAATTPVPGPVHLNLPFREPLVAEPGPLPAGRAGGAPWVAAVATPSEHAVEIPAGARTLVVAGPGADRHCAAWGWPVLADPAAGLAGPGVVAHADPVVRDAATADALRPDVIVRLGRPPASRVVNEWLAASGAEEWVAAPRWSDPAATAAHIVPWGTAVRVGQAPDDAYLADWRRADAAAEAAIAGHLASLDELSEPAVARAVSAAMPGGSHLVVASSMPVRDLEWFAPRRADVHVHANRGANGIDGTVATAIGVALATGSPTAVLVGDVALLHDSTTLVGIGRRGAHLTIVVVDNDGGGIFSFLPQARAVDPARFELLYGTPHGVRPEALAAVHGIDATVVEGPADLPRVLAGSVAAPGVRMVVARTARDANVEVHDRLSAAVAKALHG